MSSDSSHIWIFLTKYFRNWYLLSSNLLPPFWCFYQILHLDTCHLSGCLAHLHKVFCLWPLVLCNLAEEGAKWPVLLAPFTSSFLPMIPLAALPVPLYPILASDRGFVLVVTLQNWYFSLGPLTFTTWPVRYYERDDKRWGPSLWVCLSCHNRIPTEVCSLSVLEAGG